MTDDKRDKAGKPVEPDVMHGRSFAGASYANTEREQTRDRLLAAQDQTDEAGEVTDAEIEAREDSGDEPSP
jgi:hypothetical protein